MASAGAAAAVASVHTHTLVDALAHGVAGNGRGSEGGEAQRWELVSSPNTAAVADVFRAVCAFFGAPVKDVHLTHAHTHAYVSALRHGPYLPTLFDNDELVEFNQPVTGVHYLAARVSPAYPSLASPLGVHSVYVCEAAVRFAREHPLVSGAIPATTPAQRQRAVEHVRMLEAILVQRPVSTAHARVDITVGELAAWVVTRHLQHVYGVDIVPAGTTLTALLDAIEGMGALAGFKLRLGVHGVAAAPAVSGSATGAAAALVPAIAPHAAPLARTGPVLVTGANGFIASWIVSMLLEQGYTVHATVRSLADPSKHEHLRGLPHAETRLKLFEANLLDAGSFDRAMAGCTGVYHCASPFFFHTSNPHEELIRPAVEGTQNVLRAAIRETSVRRVVMTSSVAAVYVTRQPPDHFYTEEDWSDLEFVRETKQHYAESKLLSEREAWRIMKEETPSTRRLDLITMCPTQTIGPLLQDGINTSTSSILELMTGAKKSIPNKGKCFVDVRDVAMAHILAMTTPSAAGRYVLIATSIPWRTVADILRKTLPGAAIPTAVDAGPPPHPQALASIRKVFELGVAYVPVETSLRDCALSLYAKGFLSDVIEPVVLDPRQPPE